MHEMSVIQNLITFLNLLKKEQNAKRIISVEIKVHSYSCLDEENLNFLFGCIAGSDSIFKDTKIKIIRNKNLQDREYIVESVEIEVNQSNTK